jgi:hypothetical protein
MGPPNFDLRSNTAEGGCATRQVTRPATLGRYFGSCSIVASCRDSTVKSQAFEIECVAQAEKKRSQPVVRRAHRILLEIDTFANSR